MTREEAAKLLKRHEHYDIIQAYAEGKVIQWKSPTCREWNTGGDNLAFYSNYEYRIKPEPQVYEGWVVLKHYEDDNYISTSNLYLDREDLPVKSAKRVRIEVLEE